MKFLLRFMDRLRPTFTTGSLRLLRPMFGAVDSFLFSVPDLTDTAPHVRGPMSTKRYMSIVIVALIPCIAASLYFFGLRVLAMIVVTYAAGLTVEIAFAMVRKEEVNEGFFVTGLLYPLILPPGLPLWMVAVGIALAVLIGKELFGGTGRNPFNVALVGRCLLLLGYPKEMTRIWVVPGTGVFGRLGQFSYPADALTGATPLTVARSTGELAPWTDLLVGSTAGSAGATSVIAIGLGAILLLATGVASWRTIASVIGSFALAGGILHACLPQAFPAPVGWHMLAGGLMFGAVFMATDPVTSPFTKTGKWVCGAIIGVSTLLIRNLTGYVEGMMFAILLANICAPIVDDVVTRAYIRRLQREG